MPPIILGPSTLRTVDGPYRDVLREAGFTFTFPPRAAQMTEDETIAALADCPASLAGSEPYTPRVLDAHPQLKIIARVGVGYDAVDVPACTARGIVVTTTPGGNHDAVAEHTFALMLALAKKVVVQHERIQRGEWPRAANLPLRGQTLALAGLGRIGKSVARKAQAFDMTVIAYDPYPDTAFAQAHGIELVSLETLFERGDYVSLHLPLSEDSRGAIDRRYFERMKPTAFLLNTARGSVVNETDLTDALQSGRIAGAGLDVFDAEPPGLIPLVTLENVVLTAHTAGVDTRSRDDMALIAAKAVAALVRGDWPAECIVNPEVRERFRWS